MNRVEVLRKHIDEILLNMKDSENRRCAYLHLYGVAQSCALLALRRGEDAELATMAGMLHDIYTYKNGTSVDHAIRGALLARDILETLEIANENEIEIICGAIHNHSEKGATHCDFSELLKDADVMQHCLYNTALEIAPHEVARYEKIKKVLCIG
jgi:HD superfamily phosphodiesterase